MCDPSFEPFNTRFVYGLFVRVSLVRFTAEYFDKPAETGLHSSTFLSFERIMSISVELPFTVQFDQDYQQDTFQETKAKKTAIFSNRDKGNSERLITSNLKMDY